jgi:hypothetical protein
MQNNKTGQKDCFIIGKFFIFVYNEKSSLESYKNRVKETKNLRLAQLTANFASLLCLAR